MRRILSLLALAALLSSCKSEVESAYDRCVAKQTAKILEQAERGPAALKDTIEKDGPKLAEAACGPIRSMCASDPKGTICKQTMETLAGKADD